MNGKTAKLVRKLQRIYSYTQPMYQTMKKIRTGFNTTQAEGFGNEVSRMIDRIVPKKQFSGEKEEK